MPFARLLAFEPDEFEQADLRNRVAVAAAGDDQRGNDRERERNLHACTVVPCAGLALHVDGAADLLDVRFHDVHADAAAGDVGDFFGGGEARAGKSG